MTLRLTPAQLAAYNAKRGGYAPAETPAPLPADRAVLLHRPQPALEDKNRQPDGLYKGTFLVDIDGDILNKPAFVCTIPGTPVAKGRPRFDKAGHAYTPEKTRAAEAAIRSVVALAGAVPWTLAVRVEIDFFFGIPARMTREGAQKALDGDIRPILREDLDNLGKLVLDAIQGHGPGHCFADDKQVAELRLAKWYSTEPRTVLRVAAL